MKIIRHRPVGRRPEFWPDNPVRPPSRRALLVGIQYQRDEEDDVNSLKGPHKDVFQMRELLIECYSYLSEDIIVLVDTDDPKQTQPTRDNMIRAIENLVDGAQAGDRFFFHYAGHAVQIDNKNHSEEDGLDECIIPSDGESNMIRDNELRQHLVDPLPIGSNLVAIFDSCHSASLLDLKHLKCNQVYVPWISKGQRKSDSKMNANIRRQALVFSRHIYQNKRISNEGVASRRTSIEQLINPRPNYRSLSIGSTRSLRIKSEMDNETWYDTQTSPIARCSSPDSMWPCTGYCPPETATEANVIAVSACKDDQISWEDADGASMTKALVDILKLDPHPPLVHLLRDISHRLHGLYLQLHESSRIYRKKVRELNKKRARRGLRPYEFPNGRPEMDNFQDPQLSSHRPVPRDAIWDP